MFDAARVDGVVAIVTGGSGFVGRRLCELLAERGAKRVLSLDIAPWKRLDNFDSPPAHAAIEERICDVSNRDDVMGSVEPADVLFHIAALVGPFHPRHRYEAVNHQGTIHVLEACKQHGINRVVYSSSPSTRFDGGNVSGKTEDELSIRPPGAFLEMYAESKASGEVAVRDACNASADFLTVAVAPHQVYGPRDTIFLPNLMEACAAGKLRVFGSGKNAISMVHVDNYCHGLILGYLALNNPNAASTVAGEFIIVTDGPPVLFWDVLDRASLYLGHGPLQSKTHLPVAFLMMIAYLGRLISMVTGRSFKLTPFTVKMLTIDRWFKIDKAERLLGYKPLHSFEEGFESTLKWFKDNPEFMRRCAQKTTENKVFEAKKS